MAAKSVRLHNIKTINDVYKFRLEELKENNPAPKMLLLSETQRRELIVEAMLMIKDQNMLSTNIWNLEFIRDNQFKLFNILISTEERERK